MDLVSMIYLLLMVVLSQEEAISNGGVSLPILRKLIAKKSKKQLTSTKSITVYSKFASKARESTRKLELLKNQI